MNKSSLIVVFLLLIVFPGIAYYYVNKGAKYRRNLLEQLDDYGPIDPTQRRVGEHVISTEKKAVAVFFLGSDDVALAFAKKYHQQFDQRDDVLLFVAENGHQIDDPDQVWDIASSDYLAQLKSNIFAKDSTLALDGKGVLIGKDGHIRKIYPLNDEEAQKLMVAQTALYLTPKKKAKPEWRREKEK